MLGIGWVLGLIGLVSPPSGPPMLDEEDLAFLVHEAETWIWELRDEHRPLARPLDTAESDALALFFPAEVIDQARIRTVDGIANPGFYAFFHERGEPDPIDFTGVTALAVIDTVLVVDGRADPVRPDWMALLFHELVHNTQRFVLGKRDTELYVKGWAASGSYAGIPAEAQAYELAGRYRDEPDLVFSVEAEVRRMARELLAEPQSDSD